MYPIIQKNLTVLLLVAVISLSVVGMAEIQNPSVYSAGSGSSSSQSSSSPSHHSSSSDSDEKSSSHHSSGSGSGSDSNSNSDSKSKSKSKSSSNSDSNSKSNSNSHSSGSNSDSSSNSDSHSKSSSNSHSNSKSSSSSSDSKSSSSSSSKTLATTDLRKFLSMSGSPADGKGSSAQSKIVNYDIQKGCAPSNQLADRPNPTQYLTYFNCGHTTIAENGSTTREFTLVIEENHKIPITLPDSKGKSIMFPAWTFNGTVPGPTMRMTEGDKVTVNVINRGTMVHTLHMHSIHPGNMDGVPGLSGDSGNILPGKTFSYTFTAAPFGVYPYHCHANPISVHINHGLYGAMIIDPPVKEARPVAKEMVFFLNGYNLKLDKEEPRMPTVAEANKMMVNSDSVELPDEHDNTLYTMNGVAFYYVNHPINITTGELVRAYVVNMLDFEENALHIHGNLFQYYPSGTSLAQSFTSDVITLSQGDRGIIEFKYPFAGDYMMHAHLDQIASRGWMSVLHVTDNLSDKTASSIKPSSN